MDPATRKFEHHHSHLLQRDVQYSENRANEAEVAPGVLI